MSDKLYWVRVEVATDLLVVAPDATEAKHVAAKYADMALGEAGAEILEPRPLTDSQINACDPDEPLWGSDFDTLGEWLDERMVQGGMPEPVVLDHPDQGSLFS